MTMTTGLAGILAMVVPDLAKAAQKHRDMTGKDAMLVVIEHHDQTMAVHKIGFDHLVGLLVDGKPPSTEWQRDAKAFHPMQWAAAILH